MAEQQRRRLRRRGAGAGRHCFGLLAGGAGLPLTYPAELVPHEPARRLLERLGVRIVGAGELAGELERATVRDRVQAALEQSTAPAGDPLRMAAAAWLERRS